LAEEQANKEGGEEQQAAAEAEAVKKKPTEAAPGGLNPKLILVVLALNLLVLLALTSIVWMNYKKQSSEMSLAQIAISEKGGKEAHGGDAHGGGGDGHGGGKKEAEAPTSHFIKESFTVNLADSRGAHFAKVDVEFEVEDDFAKDEMERLRPKIRDFITIVLSSKTYEQVESVDGRDFLREEIRNKINGYLTRGQVKNVFFTQFIVQ
jgi:flagellar FliL protein